MKSKPLTMQRAAQRAMKHAIHIGVDPTNTVIVQGACFAKPFAVPRIKAWEKRQDKARRIYTRSHAIEVWDNEAE